MAQHASGKTPHGAKRLVQNTWCKTPPGAKRHLWWETLLVKHTSSAKHLWRKTLGATHLWREAKLQKTPQAQALLAQKFGRKAPLAQNTFWYRTPGAKDLVRISSGAKTVGAKYPLAQATSGAKRLC